MARTKFDRVQFFKDIGYAPRPDQWPIHNCTAKVRCLSAGVRYGKAIWIGTPILTGQGWKTMEDIRGAGAGYFGDVVFGPDGKKTRVVSATKIMLNHECYKVTFCDGTSLIADAEHEWKVKSRNFRKHRLSYVRKGWHSPGPVKKTTEELAKDFIYTRKNGKEESEYSIPVCEPLRIRRKSNLRIDPYVLGLWLGDGYSNSGMISIGDEDEELTTININKRGYGLLKSKSSRMGYSILIFKDGKTQTIHRLLKEIGVWRNKHIPDNYKLSSAEQRLDLLKGLMDSDGYINGKRDFKDGYNRKRGRCEITLVNRKLIDDTREIIHSLGMKSIFYTGDAKIDGRYIGKKYRVNFRPTMQVFSLKRKADRFVENCSTNMKERYIKDIQKVDSVPVKCITVDNESHMYLAGKSLIPTCNSILAASEMLAMTFLPHKIEYPTWIVSSSYDNADAIFEPAYWIAKNKLGLLSKRCSLKYRIIMFLDGKQIEAKSAEEPGSLEAKGLHFLVTDESREIKNDVWYGRIEARTLDTNARMLLLSSGCKKKGPYNWFYAISQSENPKPNHWDGKSEVAYWQYPSTVNPLCNKEKFESLRKRLPPFIFKERYLGEMIDESGELFPNSEMVFLGKPKEPVKGHTYSAGLDIAISRNLTVLSIFDNYDNSQVFMDAFPKGLDWEMQEKRVAGAMIRYNNAVGLGDATGIGSSPVEAIRKLGANLEPLTISSKGIRNQLVQDAMSRFANVEWTLLDDPDLKKDFGDLTCDLNASLLPTYKSSTGLPLDRMFSVLLANQLLAGNEVNAKYTAVEGGKRTYTPDESRGIVSGLLG